MEGKQKPKKTFRYGAISASVWENTLEIEKGKFVKNYSVSIVRNYQGKDQKWASTSSFKTNDLYAVIKVADAAYEYIKVGLKEEEPLQPQVPEMNMATGQVIQTQRQPYQNWRGR